MSICILLSHQHLEKWHPFIFIQWVNELIFSLPLWQNVEYKEPQISSSLAMSHERNHMICLAQMTIWSHPAIIHIYKTESEWWGEENEEK